MNSLSSLPQYRFSSKETIIECLTGTPSISKIDPKIIEAVAIFFAQSERVSSEIQMGVVTATAFRCEELKLPDNEIITINRNLIEALHPKVEAIPHTAKPPELSDSF